MVQGTGDNNVGTHSVSHDNDGDRGNVFDIDGGENAAGYSNGNPEYSVTSDFESQSIAADSPMPSTESDITSTSAAGAAAVTAGLVVALVGFLAVLA